MMDEIEKRELLDLLDMAEENARSDWEVEFVESLLEQAENPFFEPTDRQWEKLQELADR